ncbi:MAG: nitroreductase family protein [Firmicutes bacterium]|nr:nitroreductase family protein [Bacillota bacterium]
MNFFEVVNNRHSYRDTYADKPVPEEDIRKILEAAIKAPSGWNLQSTRFVVINDPGKIAAVNEVLPMDAVKSAKALIVMVTKAIDADGLCFEVEDYGIACAYVMLATTALGYATVCLDGDVQENDNRAKLAKIIETPDDVTVRAVFPIGVPASEMAAAPRMAYEERVSYNKY